MSIAQINASYVPSEDRVLFRFNTTQDAEFRLWLTRRVVQLLLEHLQALAMAPVVQQHGPAAAPAVAAFRQASAQDKARYSDFQPARQLPLGAEPVLVNSFQWTPAMNAPRGAVAGELRLLLAHQQTLKLPMNESLLRQIVMLLEQMQAKAGWGLALHAQATPARQDNPGIDTISRDAPPNGPVLH